ncbi:MAG TPA: universal stress protein [Lactobacillus sp.]|nr:universal stress protein [Lactobacillus sp.]
MTFAPKHILVPVDGSENSKLALTKAVDIANAADAEILLLQVVAPLYSSSEYAVAGVMDGMVTRAKQYVGELAEKTKQETKFDRITPFVTQDAPKPTIAKSFPETHHVDLIVIGATGTNAFERAILGSTTGYVIRNADIDVLVIKDNAGE